MINCPDPSSQTMRQEMSLQGTFHCPVDLSFTGECTSDCLTALLHLLERTLRTRTFINKEKTMQFVSIESFFSNRLKYKCKVAQLQFNTVVLNRGGSWEKPLGSLKGYNNSQYPGDGCRDVMSGDSGISPQPSSLVSQCPSRHNKPSWAQADWQIDPESLQKLSGH